jgi:hypothetical protein
MKIISVIYLSLVSVLFGVAQESGRFLETMKEIGESSVLSEEERIQFLSKLVTVGDFTGDVPGGYKRDSEEQRIFKRAQSELISISGHAYYFVKPIQEAYDRAAQGKHNIISPTINGEPVNISRTFLMLSQLPSADIVEVLGEFLVNDKAIDSWLEESRDVKSQEQFDRLGVNPPLALGAATALYFLPLKTKPVKNWSGSDYDQVLKWRDWYQQIKEGRRTFSFEGDPQEYDLTGPVHEARNPDIARVTKRPNVSEGAIPLSQTHSKSTMIWGSGFFVALAGLIGYLYMRKTKFL